MGTGLINNLRRNFVCQRRSLTVTLLLLLMVLVGCREGDWTPERVENILGVPIPLDAVDVKYDGNYLAGMRLELSFKASSQSVSEFVDGICGGILIDGYDPFNAIDTADPIPGSILIKIPRSPHYSLSPDTPATTAGNRCIGYGAVEYQISVDRSDPNLYFVRFEIPGAFTDLTDRHGSATYINPIQGNDFPLMVIGMASEDGEFILTYRELCMDTQTQYYYQREWFPDEFYGATVLILVDDELIVSADIPEDRWNMRLRNGTDGITILPSEWGFCFTAEWPSGLHTMILNVTTTDGTEHTFSWQFRVGDNI